MARVRFSQDHTYRPTMAVAIDYKAGEEYTVRRECADEAIALGRAEEVGSRGKTEADDGGEE